jgi:hypothetical protein
MSGVEVSFGANIGQFVAGQQEVINHLTQIRYALWGLTEPVRGIRSSLGELSEAFIAAFAVDKIAGFVGQYAELGERIKAQAATLGMSVEQYQLFGYAAQMSGEDAGNAAQAIQRFEYNLQQAQNPTSRQAYRPRSNRNLHFQHARNLDSPIARRHPILRWRFSPRR